MLKVMILHIYICIQQVVKSKPKEEKVVYSYGLLTDHKIAQTSNFSFLFNEPQTRFFSTHNNSKDYMYEYKYSAYNSSNEFCWTKLLDSSRSSIPIPESPPHSFSLSPHCCVPLSSAIPSSVGCRLIQVEKVRE